MFTQINRAWIYRVLIAIGLLVTFYGFMTQQEVALWLGLITTAFNLMPAANTSTRKKEDA